MGAGLKVQDGQLFVDGEWMSVDQWEEQMSVLLNRRENANVDIALGDHRVKSIKQTAKPDVFNSMTEYIHWKTQADARAEELRLVEKNVHEARMELMRIDDDISRMMPPNVTIRIYDPHLEEPGTYAVSWKLPADANKGSGHRPIVTVRFEIDSQ